MKNKNWLIYTLLLVVAFLTIKQFSYTEKMPVQPIIQTQTNTNKPAPEKLKLKIKSPQPQPQLIKAATDKISFKPYKVKSHYPTQDVFDENICSIDKLHIDYKPSLAKAINRLNNQYQQYNYKINDYLTLTVYAVKITEYFEKELTARIKALHYEYISLLGDSAKRKINLNLVITPERSEYEHYLSFYIDRKTESIGVYFGGLNIAYVDYQNSDHKALKTATHETIHALNTHIIGKTPRMFNEGMAEFYENMSVEKGKIDIVFSRKQLIREPLPLTQFFDYQQWSNLDIHHLYYSSWAWIAFMYGEIDRIESLISFMKKEQIDPCSAFSADESYDIFRENNNMFESDFYYWQKNLNLH
jgi:hypothetical protein